MTKKPTTIPFFQIDAFATRPFSGNPAAVCLLDEEADPTWMQSVAAEMNLSETAFVRPEGDEFGLRWFTPTTEVKLCGHATLAASHALWEAQRVPSTDPVRYATRSGDLVARRDDAGIEIDLPALVSTDAKFPADLRRAYGVDPIACRELPASCGDERYLVELASAADVRAVAPDFGFLRAANAPNVIVTARGDEPTGDGERFDIVSRYFAPSIGIDEDPATGAAHCVLAPYWCDKIGRKQLRAYQASARGGVLDVGLDGDRVFLRGGTVTIIAGALRV